MFRLMGAVACAVLFSVSSASLRAQGGIVWPGVTAAPSAIVVRVDDRHFDVFFPGFVTYPSILLFGGDDVAVGVGIEPGSVRVVDETEVVDEGDGEEMIAPLFDLKLDAKITGQFDALVQNGRLYWSAFKAQPSVNIPSFRGSTLRFRFSSPNPIRRADFEKQILGSYVGVATVDANGNIRNNARLFMLKTAAIVAPAMMYYKFERTLGDIALNFVDGYAGAPPTGKITASSSAMFTTGWGPNSSALSGGNTTAHYSCDTGWKGGVGGSFTIAWYMKQRNPLGTSVSRFFEIGGGLRCFTNGPAGKGLRVTGWGQNVGAVQLNADVQKGAEKNWLHVALVFNGAARKVRLVLNGSGGPTVNIARTPFLRSGNGTLVLGGAAGAPNFYDLDEFRFAPFAASNAQIATWAKRGSAGTARYGEPSGCLMTTRNGPPRLGNNAFEISAIGSPNSKLAMVFGAAAKPSPLPWGTWHIMFPAVIVPGNNGANGLFRLPINIPNNNSLRGVVVNGQTYMVTPKNNAMVSNAIAMAIE